MPPATEGGPARVPGGLPLCRPPERMDVGVSTLETDGGAVVHSRADRIRVIAIATKKALTLLRNGHGNRGAEVQTLGSATKGWNT